MPTYFPDRDKERIATLLGLLDGLSFAATSIADNSSEDWIAALRLVHDRAREVSAELRGLLMPPPYQPDPRD